MRDLFPPPTPEAAITNLLLLSSAQLCLTLCTVACQAPLSHGISQERILEWVAISFSRGIFPAQGSNPGLLGLLHWQADSLPVAPPGRLICHRTISWLFSDSASESFLTQHSR